MTCLLLALAVLIPRLTIILLVIFGDYVGRAYDTWGWPLLGFFVAPTTTLAYAVARNDLGGPTSPLGIIVMVLAILIDLGVFKGGHAKASVARRRR